MTKTNQLKMPLDGNGINILRQCGPAIKDVLKYKYECSIDVLGMDSVMGEDFAHAVVNVANENPPHYGGPALALCEAGGPDIQSDSDKYIKRNGALKTGDAVIGNPGYDVQWAEPQLKRTVKSILDRAEENNFKSVAIPALSSVVFNFPVDKCTDIIVDTVRKYIECGYQRGILCEIVLVNNDEPAVKEMERACRQAFGSMNAPVSQAARSKTNTSGSKTSQTPLTVQIGNVHLTLRKGYIQEQETDVIVNTTGDNLCLSNGEVSKAILKKAGSKMQEEIDKKYKIAKKSLPLVLKTNSYGLGCKDVYHTLVPVKGVDRAGEVTTSIAFPAIGTGHLGFTKQEVAQIMTKAVEDSAQKMQTKMEVDFVIHPPENDTFMVTYSSARVYVTESLLYSLVVFLCLLGFDEQNTSSAPEVRMSSASIEANEEARSWLEELLRCSGTATVNNNFIQYLGVEELHQLNSGAAPATWIEEFFEKGCAKIKVQAESPKDVIVHVLKAETLLCAVQKEFARGVKAHMPMPPTRGSMSDAASIDPGDREHQFKEQGLSIQRVRNFLLQNPKYGEGIYFSGSVRGAVDLWREQSHQDVYQYYVEAKVLTGKSTPGKRDLIMPPPVGDDPLVRFESLSGGTDICVIFNGHQALPECIIICKSQSQLWRYLCWGKQIND
uniref:Macro domain-containing protein n=1 Tax=Gadus morhua TaxID=8049 RepID=A0A8C5BSH0_GADMO